jgi:hypothetical protein
VMNIEDGTIERVRDEDWVRDRTPSSASHFRSTNITGVRLQANSDYRKWSELNLVTDKETSNKN